jgi:hypothetical protein
MQSIEEIRGAGTERGLGSARRDVSGVVARHFRDARDIQIILRLSALLVISGALLVLSVSANIYQYYEDDDLVVMDKDSGRVLVINKREYGETESVKLSPDRITEQDKKYLATEFVTALFRLDPASRVRDIERALRMMVPESAPRFAEYLTKNRVLERERKESQQAIWTAQDVSLDPRDPWTVRVIGEQELTRNLANAGIQTEKHQYAITLKLAADPSRRADRNLRSGVLVGRVEWKEITPTEGGPR